MKELREKVRAVCLLSEPNVSMILQTLDELVQVSLRTDDEEADHYEEFARQANRHQKNI